MGITQFGAFTPSAAQLIQSAINKAGFGTTGKVFYCDPANGLDSNDGQLAATVPGTTQGPVQTLLAGYNLLRSGFNDVLVLIGNGQSSGSARITSFTWAKNAAHLIGICAPSAVSQRARIANPTTAGLVITANFFTVSGNGCLFSNLSWFQGAGAGQTGIAAAILVTITGSRNAFVNCDFEGMGDATSATDAGSRCILISGGGQENFFKHCNVGLDTVERTNANASVEIAGGGPRNIFEDCTFPFWSSDGLQYALLANAAASLDRWVLFKGCNFIAGIGTAIAQLFHLAAAVGGILCMDAQSASYLVTAYGDATTLTQIYLAGVAGTTASGVAHRGS
jgi:hypothetical protein